MEQRRLRDLDAARRAIGQALAELEEWRGNYAAPDLARTQTKSYLRNLLEPIASAESNVRDFPGKKP